MTEEHKDIIDNELRYACGPAESTRNFEDTADEAYLHGGREANHRGGKEHQKSELTNCCVSC